MLLQQVTTRGVAVTKLFMSYLALYRKYRPQTFAEVVGQAHVKTTLLNALSSHKLAHAYLFCGPRGVGKTTIGRLLARAANCQQVKKTKGEPCGKCSACQETGSNKSIDLVEIDAASNRGIDEIRELREKVKFVPTKLDFRVFIIDEVHMLTIEAFNALLKTLEEPPEHVIFILATTDPQKIPATILSRCQRFDFTKLSQEDLAEHLNDIANQEKITIESGALDLIAVQADGSSRDALSLLGQAAVAYDGQKINIKDLRTLLGLASSERLLDFVATVFAKKLSPSLQLVNDFINEGYAAHQLIEDILASLRRLLIIKSVGQATTHFSLGLSQDEIKNMTKCVATVTIKDILQLIYLVMKAKDHQQYSLIPQLPLEMAIIEFIGEDDDSDSQGVKIEDDKEDLDSTKKDSHKKSTSDHQAKTSPPKDVSQAASKQPPEPVQINSEMINQKWSQCIDKICTNNYSLGLLLKSTQPQQVKNGSLLLACQYEFHKEVVQKNENRLAIEKMLNEVYNTPLKLNCCVSNKVSNPPSEDSRSDKSNLVKDAMDILGGKVVK